MSENKKLEFLIKKCNTLKEIKEFLKKQDFIENVSISDYIIKTAPPIREVFVVLKLENGSKKTKVVDVKVHSEKRIEFYGIHDK